MTAPARLTEERPDQLANLRAGTWCDCCLTIYAPDRPGLVRAEYWWLTPAGTDVPLCARCTAIWRANAEQDPSLAPARITTIGRADDDDTRPA